MVELGQDGSKRTFAGDVSQGTTALCSVKAELALAEEPYKLSFTGSVNSTLGSVAVELGQDGSKRTLAGDVSRGTTALGSVRAELAFAEELNKLSFMGSVNSTQALGSVAVELAEEPNNFSFTGSISPLGSVT